MIGRIFIHLVFLVGTSVPCLLGQSTGTVRIWQEPLVLPTYKVHPPDVNPMFRRPLSYQGASKVIYPYPLLDNLSNIREDKTYNAAYLENEYIKLCVLPELGGKLFYATDKTNGYEIFYRQHVIKPSNIGMLGAWTSGGVEWCVFHHHRASTFMSVDYTLSENDDGSKTIWIGEIEPRHRMKWTVGITLYPGRSYVEAHVKIFNRTENTNSFLYWANVATHVNESYQIFFPPSTAYGTYHAKNYFVHWPIAKEKYLGRDYVGVDLSWWKNHPRPVSIFAHDLKEGFLAGYDHGKQAGTAHVGNHHIVAGAKLWEWGPGDVGRMWDTQVLTDTDGPYAELMVGAYSDNQPDYSWIKPYEVKQCKQYWYPLREIGGVRSANLNAAVNLETKSDRKIRLALNTTQKYTRARALVRAKGKRIFEEVMDIGPADPFTCEIDLPADINETDLEAALYTQDGQRLIAYKPSEASFDPNLPATVPPPPSPEDIKTIEELYLTGLRIKQFHNARLNPNDYFREALRRDPCDSRCNIQLGLYYAQKGLYEDAEANFRTAIKRISRDYTRPRNCEAYYHLGLVLKRQGKYSEAYDTLYRTLWDHSFHSAAYYNLAEIACLKGNLDRALQHVNNALQTNAVNTKALNLKSAVLRRLGRDDEAMSVASSALGIDPLDHWARNECYLALKSKGLRRKARKQLDELKQVMRNYAESYIELAADYVNGGFWDEAIDVLLRAVQVQRPGISDYPTIHYYLAYLFGKKADERRANRFYKSANRCPTDYCFPFRPETLDVLREAVEHNPRDARAHYYMGNLLYDLQPNKAIQQWQKAVELENSLAIAHRNLGWGYYYAQDEIAKAISSYEKAVRHDPKQPRYHYELDLLYERDRTSVEKRLETLEKHHEHVKKREDALIREIIVLVQAGKYDKAIDYLQSNYFHIQEGNRRLHDTHVDAYLLRGLFSLREQKHGDALDDFLMADEYPENHQIGRDRAYRRNPQINYYIGLCHEALGQASEADAHFKKAVSQDVGKSEYAYYEGLAYQQLGQGERASELFDQLIQVGQERLGKAQQVDFFAKFGEGELPHVRQAASHYTMGLGYLGKGSREEAKEHFRKAVELDVNHIWARHHVDKAL